MKRIALIRSFLLAGVILSQSVSAGTDIIKCVDAQGNVTLTDAACPGNAKAAVLVAGSDQTEAAPVIGDMPEIESVAAERYSMPRIARRELPPLKPQSAMRPMARDVATLKAARANLMLLDSASQSLRAQRLALH